MPIILVGTKSDLRQDQQTINALSAKGLAMVNQAEAGMRAKEIGAVKSMECSALTQEGIDLFSLLANACDFNFIIGWLVGP